MSSITAYFAWSIYPRIRFLLTTDCDLFCDAHHLAHPLCAFPLKLWIQEQSPTQLNPFPDPTLQFVIHTQINRDGSLKPPKDITGIFAKMAYKMVSVLFTLSS